MNKEGTKLSRRGCRQPPQDAPPDAPPVADQPWREMRNHVPASPEIRGKRKSRQRKPVCWKSRKDFGRACVILFRGPCGGRVEAERRTR